MKNLKSLVRNLAKKIMSQPAVAYHEQYVNAAVVDICREYGLAYKHDQFGNIHVNVSNGRKGKPVYYVAHMDHPGFEVVSGSRTKENLKVRFLGGVPKSYFKKGSKLKFYPGEIPGTLISELKGNKVYSVKLSNAYKTRPEFGVWDIPAFDNCGDQISGRACDDLMGLTALMAGLISFKNSGQKGRVLGLVTRAEEVGFHGALAAAAAKTIPSNGLYVSLENSKELPPVKMGKGVVIRSGDRLSQFDSNGVYFLSRVAEDLGKKSTSFKFQKALMPGGACEATGFQHHGYRVAAMCIPLGNYHNCGLKNKIVQEYVSLSDTVSMAQLITESASRFAEYELFSRQASDRLNKLTHEALEKLSK